MKNSSSINDVQYWLAFNIYHIDNNLVVEVHIISECEFEAAGGGVLHLVLVTKSVDGDQYLVVDVIMCLCQQLVKAVHCWVSKSTIQAAELSFAYK